MNRRILTSAVGAAIAVVVSVSAWPPGAGAAVSQPVSGGGYYVPGTASTGSVRFIVPSPTCGIGETSALFVGLQSAAADTSSSTFASGVLSVCVAGIPGTIAIQYVDDVGTALPGVQPGDKLIASFDHGTGQATVKDVSMGTSSSIDIPDVTNQAGVFFGVHPAQSVVPMLEGGKVTLTTTVDGGSLAAASPVRQAKRIGGISLTPSAISAASGKAFAVRETNHNTA